MSYSVTVTEGWMMEEEAESGRVCCVEGLFVWEHLVDFGNMLHGLREYG